MTQPMAPAAPAGGYDPHFDELGGGVPSAGEVPLAMLLDLTLPVSIELGRTSMTVQDILRLGRGSVMQLERLAGEPIDIYVGDRRFAEGEALDDLHREAPAAAGGAHGEAAQQPQRHGHQAEHEAERADHAEQGAQVHASLSLSGLRFTMRVMRTPKCSPSTTTSPSAKRRSPT